MEKCWRNDQPWKGELEFKQVALSVLSGENNAGGSNEERGPSTPCEDCPASCDRCGLIGKSLRQDETDFFSARFLPAPCHSTHAVAVLFFQQGRGQEAFLVRWEQGASLVRGSAACLGWKASEAGLLEHSPQGWTP